MAAVHRVSGSARRAPRRAILRSVALVAVALLGGGWPGMGQLAAAGLPSLKTADPLAATTSRAARDSAVQAIPVERLDPAARAKVASVLSDISLFRRMPVSVVDCDPDLYLFMVQHPDVVVNIWEVLELSRLKLQQTGPQTYRVTDSAGMVADMEYLYHSHDVHVIYAEGTYEGPLAVRPVKGSCLMVLKTGYIRETNGRYYVTSRLDSFLQIEPGGIEILAKAFGSLVGKVADNNFLQTAAFVGSLSRTAEVNTGGVQRLAAKLANVEPQLRKRLVELAAEIARKNAATSPALATATDLPNLAVQDSP